jgi:hypothetical protein|tara:strand:- start:620 stop:1594 length:975 start_codon:yes stop_codon:yes gene_type:complete
MKAGDLFVGKQLIVGDPTLPLTGIGRPPVNIRGAGYIESPMIVGDDSKFTFPEATMMIGRNTNPDSPGVPGLFRIRNLIPGTETPQDVIIGDPSGPVGVTVYCGLSFFTVEASKISLITIAKSQLASIVDEVASLKNDVGAKVFSGAKTELGVDSNLSEAFNMAPLSGVVPTSYPNYQIPGYTDLIKTDIIAKSKKSFDIPHPTKDNHRLRYVCLEGPSAEVYVRGKLKGEHIIKLPDYWKGLVDPESVTVQLTPIGCAQNLYYEEVEWCETIKVVNADCGPVWCSYTIFAERKDTSKNIPEYQGLTPADYPGDNDNYTVNDGK